MRRFSHSTTMPAPVEALFGYHVGSGAFERLAPPWKRIRLIERQGSIRDGDTLSFRIGRRPFSMRWDALHRDYQENRQFIDEQQHGPFAHWVHRHIFLPETDATSRLEDDINFDLPFGWLGDRLLAARIELDLGRLFRWRHERTRRDLMRQQAFAGEASLSVVVSGASGLVGAALTSFLSTGGHDVRALVRRGVRDPERDIYWNPAGGQLDPELLEGIDAVIHLSGENIAGGRWTPKFKAELRRSRVETTRLLAQALAKLDRPPRVLLTASAVGYYGDRGDELLTESSPRGDGFLAELVEDWEAAAQPAEDRGIRVAHLRLGVVLAAQGGMLAQLLPVFRAGLGGVVGSGRQYLSWVSLDDVVGAFHQTLHDERLAGPINLAAPQTVTNWEFTKTLGRVLHRPTILPVPSFAVRLAFGEMGDSLLLGSCRAEPEKLLAMGFEFQNQDLEAALRWELGRI